MEIKVNDYVRTKQGDIGKARIITEYNTNIEDKKIVRTKDIIKSSPNIIDLIKVEDYVNGIKVIQVYNPEGQYVLWIKLENEEFINLDNQEDIKSIVTKEQFEQMEYKVGE